VTLQDPDGGASAADGTGLLVEVEPACADPAGSLEALAFQQR
jgi:hypothetical protein